MTPIGRPGIPFLRKTRSFSSPIWPKSAAVLPLESWIGSTQKKRSGQLVNLSRELQVCVPAGEPDRQVESKELVQALTRFLASLPPEARILFVRRYWFADSISDIASQCQISTAKVKTSLHRTRKKLKHFLEQEGFSL